MKKPTKESNSNCSSLISKSNHFLRRESSSSSSSCSLSSSKLSIYLVAVFVVIFTLFQIQSLQIPPSWSLMHEKIVTNYSFLSNSSCHITTQEDEIVKSMTSKLRESVTFLPLKDLRYANAAMKGHTWFMSSMQDTHEQGGVQYQHFPSEASGGRVLCLKGRDRRDGARNLYALAWPETLPRNSTLAKGITFISYNHYDYHNIWHGLSAMMPFVAWHIRSQCAGPTRWILYHWGELRTSMAPWVRTMLEATFGRGPLDIEDFDRDGSDGGGGGGDRAVTCFEEAVVMRHNEGGMSKEKRMEVYDLMRCRSRVYCGVKPRGGGSSIGMTMLMRDGARSFKNASAVIRVFEKECRKVEGCRLMVAYPHNLTFCEQVKLMSLTDIMVSPHGAQLTNMFLMDRNSSVMEFFPKGWLELAGVGQYVYHWLAAWSGMRHEGAWRDPTGDHCPFPENDRRCMSVFKNGRIGHDETYFSEWARRVLGEVKRRTSVRSVSGLCGCN
ncbi:PREDICTED: uncharacterized protein LOC105956058 [Erythranthe guttata]|nr:PREDICTED: uncharacterized protein LOC105956058 [Erythranthe guttata]|eukprot:XP_012835333.1 PREDICTED: uncharacterized protein LOC105956058 [Erythranthe guttata]